jgi:hypothetical protein
VRNGGSSTFAAGLHRVRKGNWTQRQPYKRGAAAVVNYKIGFVFAHRGRVFSEKCAMSVPDSMMRCRVHPFENENARNEHRAWLGAGSAEAIEKFLAEYCPGRSVQTQSGFQPRVLNRFVDDPPGDTHRMEP